MRSRRAWRTYAAAGVGAAVVAAANIWTAPTGLGLAWLTHSPDLAVWYAVNPAAVLASGWWTGRRRAYLAGAAAWAWVVAMFLLGPALRAGVELGPRAMRKVFNESTDWPCLLYLGGLALTSLLGLAMARRWAAARAADGRGSNP